MLSVFITTPITKINRIILAPNVGPFLKASISSLDFDHRGRQEGLAVASIARDDPSALPGDDPFPRARMHRDRNVR